ncbi:MAG: retropepsin-like aspartic protease family protein [Methyloligellaceae bacterium]
MSAWLALALLIASSVILLLPADITAIYGYDSHSVATGIALSAVAILAIGVFLRHNRRYLSQVFQYLVIVGTLGITTYVGYQFRYELHYVAVHVGNQVQNISNKVVSQGIQITFPAKEGRHTVVRIRKQPDGHFIARTTVNTRELNLIVDTGATVVVLKPVDAEKVGIDVESLKFNVPVQTANGEAHAARVRLHRVAVGPLAAYNVEAFVVKRGTLQKSLLGLSFLSRLKSYEVSGSYLSLRGYIASRTANQNDLM